MRTPTELIPEQSTQIACLPIASRVARRLLEVEQVAPVLAHVGGLELVARRAGARVMRVISKDAPVGLGEIEFGDDITAYTSGLVTQAVEFYGGVASANLEGNSRLLNDAVNASIAFERLSGSRGTIVRLAKKLEYARTSADRVRQRIYKLVQGDYSTETKAAVHEGAYTVLALFEVVPWVVSREYPEADYETKCKLSYQLAHTVARLTLDWSGLSKQDDAAAVARLRRNEPTGKNKSDKYTDLRLNPDYFYIAECPKTGRSALAIKAEAFAGYAPTNEPRYGCPAFANGGITKLCRAIEDALQAQHFYESQIITLDL